MEFTAYFEKEFGLKDEHERYFEFTADLDPIGITPEAIDKILVKLEYVS